MKIKFSKKILSVILAVLMVVTSVPVIAFTTSAATKSGEQEVTGVVTIDPVIYLHGAYGGDQNSPYAYMMNGNYIADGTADGEKSTAFQSTKTVRSITVVETGDTLSTSNNKLTGSLGGDYGSVTTSTTGKYVTLKFTFSDGTVEYHRLAVKANPVAQHVLGNAQRYTWGWTAKDRIVVAGLLANGSYGQRGGSFSYSEYRDMQSSNSGEINHPSMYHMWNPSYLTDDKYISGLDDNRISADKIAGYAARTQGNNGTAREGNAELVVNAATATYYYDVSSSDNEGFYNNDTIQMLVSALNHSGWQADCYPINLMSNSVSDTNAFSIQGATPINGSITGTDCFSYNADAYGYFNILLRDKSVGTKSATFSVKYQHQTSTPYAGLTLNMPFQVIISDKTDIRNTYNEYIGLNLVSKCYTADSWETYKNALLTAESYLNDYQSYDSATQTAFMSALVAAKNGLVPVEDNTDAIHSFTETGVVEPTCTAQGYTHHTCEHCGYTYNDNYVEAKGHSFVYTPIDGEFNHTVSCSVGDIEEPYTEACADGNDDGECDKCGNSLHADWTKYVTQLTALREALKGTEDSKLPVSTLENINRYFDDTSGSVLTYYELFVSGQQNSVPASQQAALDYEADIIKGLIPDGTQYIQVQEALTAVMEKDIDQYDSTEFDQLQAGLTQEVVIGANTYEGVSYANQDELDQALRDALNSAMTYNVYLNDQLVLSDVDYGRHVIISGDGTVLGSEEEATQGNYSWSGFFAAPSYGENTEEGYNYNTSTERYLTTAPAYSFIVKGDSYLTAVGSSDDEQLCRVTVKNNVTGFISNIFYVPTNEKIGTELEQSQRNIAFYTFDNFYNAPTDGEVVTADTIVSSDMVVYARYTVDRVVKYEINAYPNFDSFYAMENKIIEGEYQYNEAVEISTDREDFYCWVTLTNPDSPDHPFDMQVLSFEKNYKFYAYERSEIIAMSYDELVAAVTNNGDTFTNPDGTDYDPDNKVPVVRSSSTIVPIYSSSDNLEKVSLIGNFAVPEGYTVLEKGFLIDFDSADVAAEDFNVLNEGLTRAKVLHLTEGNQFVLNIIGGGNAPMDYRAYAVVEDAEGNRTEIYSAVTRDAVVG